MKGLQQTLILLGILLILTGVIWWLAFTQEEALEEKVVLRLPVQEIHSLEIEHLRVKGEGDGEKEKPPSPSVLTRKADREWLLTAPVTDQAETGVVQDMLDVLAGLTTESMIKEVTDYSQYGLDQPVFQITVGLANGASKKLLIGDETPIAYKYYARFADAPEVYVINGVDRANLDLKPKNLRLKKVLPVETDEITGIVLQKDEADSTYTLSKEKDEWQLQSPFTERLAHHMILDFLRKLSELKAEDFIDDLPQPAAYGLDKPQITLVLTTAQGERVTLKVGETPEGYFLTHDRRDPLLKLEQEEPLEFLDFDLNAYINKNLNSLEKNQARSVVLKESVGPELTVAEENLGDVWWGCLGSFFFQEPYFHPAKTEPVPREAFADRDPVYEVIIKVKSEGKQRKDREQSDEDTGRNEDVYLKVYPSTEGDNYLITSSQRRYVYKINRETVDDLIERIKETVELQEEAGEAKKGTND